MKRLQGMMVAPNAVPLSGEAGADGWYLIAPYGEWPTADGKLVQVFGREQAEAMVAHFNSVPFRVSRWLGSNQVPVTIGHPEEDPRTYTDHRLLAPKHLALEAREDGLWGQAAWNALGKENLAESYWRVPSPVWLFKAPAAGSRKVYPDILRSVGLTNFPNIPDAVAVTANAGELGQDSRDSGQDSRDSRAVEAAVNGAADGYAEESTTNDDDNDNNDDDMNGLKSEEVAAIIAALELEEGAGSAEILEAIAALREAKQTATSEEDAAMEAANAGQDSPDSGQDSQDSGQDSQDSGAVAVAVNAGQDSRDLGQDSQDSGAVEAGEDLSAANDALASSLATAQADLVAANAALATAAAGREAAANAIATLAVESGLVTGAEREALRFSLIEAGDFAAAANAVLERQPTGLDRAAVTLGRETVLLNSPEQRAAAWNAALATVAEEIGLPLEKNRDAVWQRTKKDPRFSRIWDAMESAGKG